MSHMRAVVSGSFRRHLDRIQSAVDELTAAGVDVLSPADPRVVDEFGEFLFVASDRLRSIHAVQSRHLAAIRISDFVWLVDPEGYVGQSASMELGFAVACRTPIFTSSMPNDLTLRQYVRTASSLQECIRIVRQGPPTKEQRPLLVDPIEGASQLHFAIDQLEQQLIAPPGRTNEQELMDTFGRVHSLLDLP